MFKFTKTFAAVALAVASISASAQNTSNNNSDLFNQDSSRTMNSPSSSNMGESSMMSSTLPRRVSITNSRGNELDAPSMRDEMTPELSEYQMQMRERNGERDPQQRRLDRDNRFDGSRMQNGDLSNRAWNARKEASEFQKFVADNTGKLLPIFGTSFFANTPSTFAPVSNAPVPSDYALGPGDELTIRGWGTIDIDYRATVDRNGTISIPTIGTVALAGVKASEAQNVIRAAVGRLYKGVTVNVSFGKLRAITVYVVGQAKRPGTYTVSSLSTLVTALFASGGPNANGSMRHVQVKRGGKVAAELDLYAFVAKGDKSADVKLQDGDTIFIPPAGGFVALTGKVNSPAIFELKTGSDTVESLLDVAGGLPVVADPRRAFLERIAPTANHPRSVEQFALEGQGLKRTLKNGDVLNVTSITPDFSNAVILRGNVDQPVRAPFKTGMRVSDLIPNREYLISRASTQHQNSVLADDESEKSMLDRKEKKTEQYTKQKSESIASRIGNLIEQVNWDYAVIERVNRTDLTVKLIPFNLGNVFTNPNGPDNVQLQPGDTVTVFSQDDVAVPMDKRQIFARVEGEVRVPGVYQLSAGDTLQTLIAKAGGPTSNAYLFGTGFYREEVRKEQEVNLQRAADRLETQIRSEQSAQMANLAAMSPTEAAASTAQFEAQRRLAEERIARFRKLQPTGRIAFGLDLNERSFARLPQVSLQNGDRLVVPSKPAFVHVFGSVNVEASPLWRPNSRVKDYLKMAGTTTDADVDNTFVMRVDGTVVSSDSQGWFFGKIGGLEVMPGDTIVVPEKLDKTTAWTKFMQGAREWTQILANLGLGAAAVKTLRD
jgi:protein involved in polysaccharide export with SLBB domain